MITGRRPAAGTLEVVHVHRGPAGDGHREVSTAAGGDVLTVPGTDLTVDVVELLGP